MNKEQQYWEDTQEALSRIFDRCEEIDPQSGYDMLEDIQFIRGFINKHKPRTEEQEPCEDVMAIHTQGLAEGIRCAMCTNSIKSDRGCDGGCIVDEDMYKKVVDTIRNHIVPPAAPKRKVGEWIKKNNDYFDWYECSECGYGSEGEMRYSREYDVRTNYCPKCGTQMLEVENEIN